MLRELSVQNLALIEDVRVELQPGFCAWTGETGAGKTLLLTALGLLLGDRGSADLVRTGAEELRIVGSFELTRPDLRQEVETRLNRTLEDETLIVTRRLTRAGRSFAYVNDQPVAVATLRQLGPVLVDVHGQRESLSLLLPAYQMQSARRLWSSGKAATGVSGPGRESAAPAKAIGAQRTEHRQQRLRELSLLRFEREELDAANLTAGELAELLKERERLSHGFAMQSFAETGCARLYDEEGSVFENIGKLVREAETWSKLDDTLADLVRRLQSLNSEVQDVAETLRELAQRWQADPARREEIEERVQLIRRLETKYGKSVDDLIAYRTTLDEQEKGLAQQEEDRATLEKELGTAFVQLRQAGAELSKQRHLIAKKLATAVQKHLADLGMPDAHLEAQLEPQPLGEEALTAEVPGNGLEQLELMLAANKGEPVRRCARSPAAANCRGPCWR